MDFLSKTLDSSKFKESVYDNNNYIPIVKSKPPLPFNNVSIHGYTVNRKINTVISISRPKFWPSKYYKEVVDESTFSQNNKETVINNTFYQNNKETVINNKEPVVNNTISQNNKETSIQQGHYHPHY
jgi:hypothetical protein